MNYPNVPRDLMRWSQGPEDYNGAGWERYYDMTEAQRADSLGAIVSQANGSGIEARFARGWLDALECARRWEGERA